MNNWNMNHRLFQRGQTWLECRESWTFQRDYFLKKTLEQPQLATASEAYKKMKADKRILVYYSWWALDSLKSLPVIGNTLALNPQIEVRYFRAEVYVPVLYAHLGRKAPQIVLLNDGEVDAVWGPRPELMTRELKEQRQDPQVNIDQWFWTYNEDRYLSLLDESLSAWFQSLVLEGDL